MSRSPFDLTFDDLIDAGAAASAAAVSEAERAGVAIAALEPSSDRTNVWDDERVATLKKLWLDGLSASRIAALLGGVTRNGVVGKVVQLGLAARPVEKTHVPFESLPPVATPPKALPAFRAEEPGSATVLTLGAHMCKWPIGDPSSEGFTFCGRRASEGPYCVIHARVAYQPQQTKKKAPSAPSSLIMIEPRRRPGA